MKNVVVLLLIASSSAMSQQASRPQLTLVYFGGTDCYYCNLPENVKNINKMRSEFPKRHNESATKFVMVVMDKVIPDGLKYIKKYGYWDEVSIGGFYNNELMLEHVNRSSNPGVPHIMVYEDSLSVDKIGVPTISKRTRLVDLVGKSAIDNWIKDQYPLENTAEH